jgi:hypothetical protein
MNYLKEYESDSSTDTSGQISKEITAPSLLSPSAPPCPYQSLMSGEAVLCEEDGAGATNLHLNCTVPTVFSDGDNALITRRSTFNSVSATAEEREREVNREVINAPGHVEGAFEAHPPPYGDSSYTSPQYERLESEGARDSPPAIRAVRTTSPSAPSALQASKNMPPPPYPPVPEVPLDAPPAAAPDLIHASNCAATAGYHNMARLHAGKVTDGSHSVYTVPWPEPMHFYLPTKGQQQYSHQPLNDHISLI